MFVSRQATPHWRLRRSLLSLAIVAAPFTAAAQEHDDDHDHDHLHFSHPMVTESPSPDTKIRLDYLRAWTNDVDNLTVDEVRVEAEYAFTSVVSLALATPYVWASAPGAGSVSGLGSMELSLKATALTSEEKHVLVGGGVSVGLPTGSDTKGIGSSHLVELEPFLDAGYKLDALEVVGFARLSSLLHRRPDDENERVLSFDFSSLYRINSTVEALLEATTSRSLLGSERGIPETFVAPGIKLYPFARKNVMFGASFLLGTGRLTDNRAALVSAFYHF